MPKNIIIAIDGPAGSGKSTVAKFIAKKLNFLYIDTGAMYRAITLGVIRAGINPQNAEAITSFAENCRVNLERFCDGDIKVNLNNEDVTTAIRSQEVNSYVSEVARIKNVRSIMVKEQRRLGKNGNAVLEGRDIGTVVFPNARFKFFLDASVDERAKRRYKEVKDKQSITLNEITNNVKTRDQIDSNRDIAPLKKADDAIYIDTTNMTIEEVVNLILDKINAK